MLGLFQQLFSAVSEICLDIREAGSLFLGRIKESSRGMSIGGLRERFAGMLSKSTTSKEDVLKLRKEYIKRGLQQSVDAPTKVASAISGPERDAILDNQIRTHSRHSEIAARTEERAKGLPKKRFRKRNKKKSFLQLIERNKEKTAGARQETQRRDKDTIIREHAEKHKDKESLLEDIRLHRERSQLIWQNR